MPILTDLDSMTARHDRLGSIVGDLSAACSVPTRLDWLRNAGWRNRRAISKFIWRTDEALSCGSAASRPSSFCTRGALAFFATYLAACAERHTLTDNGIALRAGTGVAIVEAETTFRVTEFAGRAAAYSLRARAEAHSRLLAGQAGALAVPTLRAGERTTLGCARRSGIGVPTSDSEAQYSERTPCQRLEHVAAIGLDGDEFAEPIELVASHRDCLLACMCRGGDFEPVLRPTS
jgi:hypothetical protein